MSKDSADLIELHVDDADDDHHHPNRVVGREGSGSSLTKHSPVAQHHRTPKNENLLGAMRPTFAPTPSPFSKNIDLPAPGDDQRQRSGSQSGSHSPMSTASPVARGLQLAIGAAAAAAPLLLMQQQNLHRPFGGFQSSADNSYDAAFHLQQHQSRGHCVRTISALTNVISQAVGPECVARFQQLEQSAVAAVSSSGSGSGTSAMASGFGSFHNSTQQQPQQQQQQQNHHQRTNSSGTSTSTPVNQMHRRLAARAMVADLLRQTRGSASHAVSASPHSAAFPKSPALAGMSSSSDGSLGSSQRRGSTTLRENQIHQHNNNSNAAAPAAGPDTSASPPLLDLVGLDQDDEHPGNISVSGAAGLSGHTPMMGLSGSTPWSPNDTIPAAAVEKLLERLLGVMMADPPGVSPSSAAGTSRERGNSTLSTGGERNANNNNNKFGNSGHSTGSRSNSPHNASTASHQSSSLQSPSESRRVSESLMQHCQQTVSNNALGLQNDDSAGGFSTFGPQISSSSVGIQPSSGSNLEQQQTAASLAASHQPSPKSASLMVSGAAFPAFQHTTRLDETEGADGMRHINHFILLMPIGEGMQGTVHLGLDTETNEVRAVKEVARPTPNVASIRAKVETRRQRRRLQQEISIMKRCRHPNLVTLYEVIDDPNATSVFLIMKFIEHGPLLRIDGEGKGSRVFSVRRVAKYAAQLCSALEYLHQRRICHADIKVDNVMLGADDTVYLADFGVSRIFPVTDEQRRGSLRHMPGGGGVSQQASRQPSRRGSMKNLFSGFPTVASEQTLDTMGGGGDGRGIAASAAAQHYDSNRFLDRIGGAAAFRPPESYVDDAGTPANCTTPEPSARGGALGALGVVGATSAFASAAVPDAAGPTAAGDGASSTTPQDQSVDPPEPASPGRKAVNPRDLDKLRTADVFALGLCLYVFLYGAMPYPTNHMMTYIDSMAAPEAIPLPATAKHEAEEVERRVLDALAAMLAKDPAQRCSVQEAHAAWNAIHADYDADEADNADFFAGMSTASHPFGDSDTAFPSEMDDTRAELPSPHDGGQKRRGNDDDDDDDCREGSGDSGCPMTIVKPRKLTIAGSDGSSVLNTAAASTTAYASTSSFPNGVAGGGGGSGGRHGSLDTTMGQVSASFASSTNDEKVVQS